LKIIQYSQLQAGWQQSGSNGGLLAAWASHADLAAVAAAARRSKRWTAGGWAAVAAQSKQRWWRWLWQQDDPNGGGGSRTVGANVGSLAAERQK
jgi:hypothetical protein